jgi:hypothetical protein
MKVTERSKAMKVKVTTLVLAGALVAPFAAFADNEAGTDLDTTRMYMQHQSGWMSPTHVAGSPYASGGEWRGGYFYFDEGRERAAAATGLPSLRSPGVGEQSN